MTYFFDDLTALSLGTMLALGLLLVPGFGLSALMARRRLIPAEPLERTCWGMVLGLTLLPAADALLLRGLGFGGVLAPHVALAAIGARPALDAARRVPRLWWFAVGFCWLAVAWANVDFDWNGQLYQPLTVIDTVKHAAVVASLAQSGLPLHDPFFARAEPAGYYHYFYLGPALIHWLAGTLVDSRAAFAAGSFVTLLGFPAMLVLLGGAAGLIPTDARRRFVAMVIVACFVSGLDVIPALLIHHFSGFTLPQLDWWSSEVRWALTSVLWVPHHMAAVIAVFAGCLMLSGERRSPAWRAAIAGFAFATAFGSSVWIAAAAAPILALWWLYDRTKSDSAAIWVLPLSGVAALALLAPQLHDLAAGRSSAGWPLGLYVRTFGPNPPPPDSITAGLVQVALSPLGYFIDFGLFAVGAIAFLRRGGMAVSCQRSIGRLLLVAAPVAILMVTFLRSTIIFNDFGWRAIWFAQVPAMLWTASVLSRGRERPFGGPVWNIALALGLVATIWDVAGLRLVRPPYFRVAHAFINTRPEVDYDLRGAYRWIDRTLPPGLVVQHNPLLEKRAFDFGLYADRPVAVADVQARLFGASEHAVESRIALLAPIFIRPMSIAELRQRAAAASVGGILLTSADPLWRASGGPPAAWTCRYRSPHSCLMLPGMVQ